MLQSGMGSAQPVSVLEMSRAASASNEISSAKRKRNVKFPLKL